MQQSADQNAQQQPLALLARNAFERLELPVANPRPFDDGTIGLYRNADPDRPPLIPATNDWDAVQCFLRDKANSGSHHTVRAYEKECLRLFLWCRFFALKPFSSLDRQDALNYESFLRQPSAAFRLPRSPTGGYLPGTMLLPGGQVNPAWRPFRKGLGDSSVRTAIAALKSLSTYLVNADYLRASPFSLGRLNRHPTRRATDAKKKVLRAHAKRAVDAAIDAMPLNTPAQRRRASRRRYVFDLFYYLGIRMDEAINARMNAFHVIDGRCWFRTVGKGRKERTVPVPQEMVQTLAEFRMIQSMEPPFPLPTDDAPLIPAVSGTSAIKDTQVRRLVAEVFRSAASHLDSVKDATVDVKSMEALDVLKRATPHWLRHTYATDLWNAGVDPRHIKENLGHRSLDTTMIYNESVDRARHDDSQKRAVYHRHVEKIRPGSVPQEPRPNGALTRCD